MVWNSVGLITQSNIKGDESILELLPSMEISEKILNLL
jgi:hypothetical protein